MFRIVFLTKLAFRPEIRIYFFQITKKIIRRPFNRAMI